MRFTINRVELLKALDTSSRAITKSSSKTELNDLKFVLNERGLFITGSNFSLTIEYIIPYKIEEKEIIRNYEEGSLLLNCDNLTASLRKSDSYEVSFDVIDGKCIITDGASTYDLMCNNVLEYPDLDLEPNGDVLTFTGAEFINCVTSTAFAASIKEEKRGLTCINIVANEGTLTFLATNGGIVSRKQMDISPDLHFEANVPAKILQEIIRLINPKDEVSIAFNKEKALFSFGNITVATLLWSDSYPSIRGIFALEADKVLQVNSNEIIKAIDRISSFSVEKENTITLLINDETFDIYSKASSSAASSKIETFSFNGSHFEISFNYTYLLDAIKALNAEDVSFYFLGEMKPCTIKNENDPSIIEIVLPSHMH